MIQIAWNFYRIAKPQLKFYMRDYSSKNNAGQGGKKHITTCRACGICMNSLRLWRKRKEKVTSSMQGGEPKSYTVCINAADRNVIAMRFVKFSNLKLE